MATVELQFPAEPLHVRTARLVAAAAARRLGMDEGVIDEMRLAVGEAASRAVGVHTAQGTDEPITVILDDDAGRFAVTVLDRADPEAVPEIDGLDSHASFEELIPSESADGLGLAVILGLVEDVEVRGLDAGTSIRMSWPIDVPADDLADDNEGDSEAPLLDA